jgi:membrane protein implicated in regulation of membrane protease activity
VQLGKAGAAVTGVFLSWWLAGNFCHDVLHISNENTFMIATGLVAFVCASTAAIYLGNRANERETRERAKRDNAA